MNLTFIFYKFKKVKKMMKKYTVEEMRAKILLNEKKPQHPPAVYYIRRTPHLLEKYLNKNEANKILEKM